MINMNVEWGFSHLLLRINNYNMFHLCLHHSRQKTFLSLCNDIDVQVAYTDFLFIPPATKLGGVNWNHHVRLSARLSSTFGFPAHNCFPFTPIIMKLHMQTPHESRMCPINFEVKRSKVKVTMSQSFSIDSLNICIYCTFHELSLFYTNVCLTLL